MLRRRVRQTLNNAKFVYKYEAQAGISTRYLNAVSLRVTRGERSRSRHPGFASRVVRSASRVVRSASQVRESGPRVIVR